MDSEAKKRVQNTLKSAQIALSNLSSSLDQSFFDALTLLKNRKGKIVVTGVGKSGYIAQKIAATFTSLGQNAYFLNPTDALHGDSGVLDDDDMLVALSYSGNTQELIKLLRYVQSTFKTTIIGITGNQNSRLAELSKVIIHIPINDEGCPLGLAPMASTTTSLIIGDMLAAGLISPDHFNKHHFARFHPSGSLGLSLKKAKEIMLSKNNFPHSFENELFADAVRKVSEGGKGVTPVLNKERTLVGIITDGDIRRALCSLTKLESVTASQVMSKNPKTARPDTPLDEVLGVMEEHKITHIFITDDDELLGVVHIHDILNL